MVIMAGGFITLVVAIIRDFIEKRQMYTTWAQATKFERRQITDHATHGRLDVLEKTPNKTVQMMTLVQHLRQHPDPLRVIQGWEKYRTL